MSWEHLGWFQGQQYRGPGEPPAPNVLTGLPIAFMAAWSWTRWQIRYELQYTWNYVLAPLSGLERETFSRTCSAVVQGTTDLSPTTPQGFYSTASLGAGLPGGVVGAVAAAEYLSGSIVDTYLRETRVTTDVPFGIDVEEEEEMDLAGEAYPSMWAGLSYRDNGVRESRMSVERSIPTQASLEIPLLCPSSPAVANVGPYPPLALRLVTPLGTTTSVGAGHGVTNPPGSLTITTRMLTLTPSNPLFSF